MLRSSKEHLSTPSEPEGFRKSFIENISSYSLLQRWTKRCAVFSNDLMVFISTARRFGKQFLPGSWEPEGNKGCQQSPRSSKRTLE